MHDFILKLYFYLRLSVTRSVKFNANGVQGSRKAEIPSAEVNDVEELALQRKRQIVYKPVCMSYSRPR